MKENEKKKIVAKAFYKRYTKTEETSFIGLVDLGLRQILILQKIIFLTSL